MSSVNLPHGVSISVWKKGDFKAIQQHSEAQGWLTPANRPEETLTAWQNSWPALVATYAEDIIGFLRAVTDTTITTYVAECLVVPSWQHKGIGSALFKTCHQLYPSTRLDLLSTESANAFYKAKGFRLYSGFRKSIP